MTLAVPGYNIRDFGSFPLVIQSITILHEMTNTILGNPSTQKRIRSSNPFMAFQFDTPDATCPC